MFVSNAPTKIIVLRRYVELHYRYFSDTISRKQFKIKMLKPQTLNARK